jgi:hypothetical protein
LSLNKIDFSDGIRPEEIQENFEMLQEQINRERLGVGGFGIASGFDIETHISDNDFYITISGASLVDKEGAELFIPACKIEIDPPELYTTLEHRTINYNNTISLKQIPYANDRRRPAEFLYNKDPKISGIYINYPSNSYQSDDYIRVSNITGTILTVTGAISREVVVRYNYTADRIDAIYLKKDNTIGVVKGTTSTTPSKPVIPNDCKLLIAYVMIESRHVDENIPTPEAFMYVKEDMRDLRNIYTDKDNNLYICGTSFDDLQIIHMREPRDPKPNTLWLNVADNTLYCWKSTDTFTYSNKITIDTDFDLNSNAEIDFSTYMDFILGEKELEVYHNGNKLLENVHYYELFNSLPTINQTIEPGTFGNSFRLIENKVSGNGLIIRVGDEIRYTIKYRDSHFMWVPINKMSYVNIKNIRTYCTNDYMPENKGGYFDSHIASRMGADSNGYDYKYQYFLFHREKDIDMHFTPGRNELSILINQMSLHSDQFEEITIQDLYEWINVEDAGIDGRKLIADHAAAYYGWTKYELDKAMENNGHENSGIGFKLADPLDSGFNANSRSYEEFDGSRDIFVEAIVERRVCASPTKRKLERTATFVSEETLIVDGEIAEQGIIELKDDLYYRYKENQLEVFLNGIRLTGPYNFDKTPEYIEGFGCYLQSPYEGIDDIMYQPLNGDVFIDQGEFERKRGAACQSFKILKNLHENDIVTYRITTNIYSYDHISDLINSLESRIDCNLDSVLAAYENISVFKDEVDIRVTEAERRVEQLSQQVTELEYKEGTFDEKIVLSMSNMPPEVSRTMVLGPINTSLEYNSQSFVVGDKLKENDLGIRATDYLTIVLRSGDVNHFLFPGIDYEILDKEVYAEYSGTILTIKSSLWVPGASIYITGLKLGYGKGREINE